MNVQSYDYKNRKGIRVLSWIDFSNLSRNLAEVLCREHIDIIIGVARAGLLPATAISCMLRRELYPVRLTRRFNDEIISPEPQWKVKPPGAVLENKMVCVIDEIADSGKTMALVVSEIEKNHCRRIITATLVSHSWADPQPDYTAMESDALIIFPWDYEVLIAGEWKINPETELAIKLQDQKIV